MSLVRKNKHLSDTHPSKGQGFVNKLFGATPDKPIRLPFMLPKVETKVETAQGTKNLIIGTVGFLGVSAIIVAIILSKNKK